MLVRRNLAARIFHDGWSRDHGRRAGPIRTLRFVSKTQVRFAILDRCNEQPIAT